MKIKEIQKKLEQIKHVKISQPQLGKALGVTRQRINQLLECEATEDQIRLIEDYFNVDLTKGKETIIDKLNNAIESIEKSYNEKVDEAFDNLDDDMKEFADLYDRARNGDEHAMDLLDQRIKGLKIAFINIKR
jgi:transcriptional regulator with XRE-family HTH domain